MNSLKVGISIEAIERTWNGFKHCDIVEFIYWSTYIVHRLVTQFHVLCSRMNQFNERTSTIRSSFFEQLASMPGKNRKQNHKSHDESQELTNYRCDFNIGFFIVALVTKWNAIISSLKTYKNAYEAHRNLSYHFNWIPTHLLFMFR